MYKAAGVAEINIDIKIKKGYNKMGMTPREIERARIRHQNNLKRLHNGKTAFENYIEARQEIRDDIELMIIERKELEQFLIDNKRKLAETAAADIQKILKSF